MPEIISGIVRPSYDGKPATVKAPLPYMKATNGMALILFLMGLMFLEKFVSADLNVLSDKDENIGRLILAIFGAIVSASGILLFLLIYLKQRGLIFDQRSLDALWNRVNSSIPGERNDSIWITLRVERGIFGFFGRSFNFQKRGPIYLFAWNDLVTDQRPGGISQLAIKHDAYGNSPLSPGDYLRRARFS